MSSSALTSAVHWSIPSLRRYQDEKTEVSSGRSLATLRLPKKVQCKQRQSSRSCSSENEDAVRVGN